MKKAPLQVHPAFTLVELLVVMGIIVLMGALVVPAVSGSLKGNALSQAAQTVIADLNNAQQSALAKGQMTELRFYATADPDSPNAKKDTNLVVRAIQLYTVQTNLDRTSASAHGITYSAASKLEFLPNSMVINENQALSTLCPAPGGSGPNWAPLIPKASSEDYQHPTLPRIGLNYYYYRVQFRADGTTNLDPNRSWFLTIHALSSGNVTPTPPSNFFTVEVDPVQGSTRTFRPQ